MAFMPVLHEQAYLAWQVGIVKFGVQLWILICFFLSGVHGNLLMTNDAELLFMSILPLFSIRDCF